MKNILYLSSTLRRCGPVNQLRYIIQGLDRSQFRPQILTLSAEPVVTAIDEFRALGCQVTSLNLPRWRAWVGNRNVIARALERLSPDLVHSQGYRSDIFATKSHAGVPVLATLRNFPLDDYPMKFGRVQGRFMASRHFKALAGADMVVACSRFVAGKVRSKLPEVGMIQNGIDTNNYRPGDEIDKAKLKRYLGGTETSRVFVSAGALMKRKDPVRLIKAFLKCPALKADHLVLLGNGPLYRDCMLEKGAAQRVHLPGEVEDVRRYLAGADYFLSAALSEGLPNSVLEAFSSGLPVGLTDIPPHRELLGTSCAGVLLDLSNQDSFLGSIKSLVAYNYSESSAASLNLAKNDFCALRMSREYQSLYSTLLGAR